MIDADCHAKPGGYVSSEFSRAFLDHGTPLHFNSANGWVIRRNVPATDFFDAMGCYPIFCCEDWHELHHDFSKIDEDIISIALVTDPFGNHSSKLLHSLFPDVAKPYKEHFVIDLTLKPEVFVSSHHQRYSKQALGMTKVSLAQNSPELLDEWCTLYDNLIHRHQISGMATFSRESFSRQLHVPGTIVFRAELEGCTVGLIIWYVQGDRAYYHLAAYSDKGYEIRASFALFWTAIHYFSQAGLHWLCLGAGAGLSGNGTDGLTRFKQGWSTGTKTAYFCGRIFNPALYEKVSSAKGTLSTPYFPAYRTGEFS